MSGSDAGMRVCEMAGGGEAISEDRALAICRLPRVASGNHVHLSCPFCWCSADGKILYVSLRSFSKTQLLKVRKSFQ